MSNFKCIVPRSSSKISDDCSRFDAERFDIFSRVRKSAVLCVRVHNTSIPRRHIDRIVLWGFILHLPFGFEHDERCKLVAVPKLHNAYALRRATKRWNFIEISANGLAFLRHGDEFTPAKNDRGSDELLRLRGNRYRLDAAAAAALAFVFGKRRLFAIASR